MGREKIMEAAFGYYFGLAFGITFGVGLAIIALIFLWYCFPH